MVEEGKTYVLEGVRSLYIRECGDGRLELAFEFFRSPDLSALLDEVTPFCKGQKGDYLEVTIRLGNEP